MSVSIIISVVFALFAGILAVSAGIFAIINNNKKKK